MSGFEFESGKLSFTFNGIAALGVLGGTICIFLGYKLFQQPIPSGTGTMTAKIAHGMADMGITGPWPGIFFMGFGALIIIVGILSAGAAQATRPSRDSKSRSRSASS